MSSEKKGFDAERLAPVVEPDDREFYERLINDRMDFMRAQYTALLGLTQMMPAPEFYPGDSPRWVEAIRAHALHLDAMARVFIMTNDVTMAIRRQGVAMGFDAGEPRQ